MIEAKKKNINVYVQTTKLVADTAVCVSFSMNIDGCCLNRLDGCMPCNSNPVGIEQACVVYSIYLKVKNLLCGDPVAVKNSKVSSVCCGAHNGQFFITWSTKGTVSAVRKSLGIALKGLVPGKLYTTYRYCMRGIDGKPNRETFNYAANEVLMAINKDLHCGVVGNMKADKAKVEKMVDVVSKKINPGDVATPRTKPSGHTPCEHENYTSIKVSGWATHVVKDYVMSKVIGLNPLICNKALMLPMKESDWKGRSLKLKKESSDFVKARYAKLGDDLSVVIAYMAITNGSVSCCDVKALLKSNITSAQVASTIKDSL